MFAKSRKEKFVEQAQDLAHDLTEAIAPRVERARDEIAPRLSDARDTLAARTSDARDSLAPRFADARDTVAPHVENARDRLVKDVVPAVQQAVNDAREQAGPVAEEARRRGVLAAAALKGEPVQEQKKGSKTRALLVIAALAGAGAFVAKKLSGGGAQDNWQSSYTPTPAPATPSTPSTPPSPAAPMAGATPGEALADSTEEPHPVTTPDSPAESVQVDKDPKP